MKKLFSLLTLALLTMSAWADTTVTIDFTAQGYENGQAIESCTVDNVTVSFDKGTNSNAPKYYNAGTAMRLYGGNSMTVAAPANLKSIEFTFGSGEGTNAITSTPGNYVTANNTWTIGSDPASASVVFTIGGTSGHRRVQKLVVTMEDLEPVTELVPPVFTPAGGEITQSTEVTLTCATPNAEIQYYECDPTTHEIDWTTYHYYTAPFYVNETKSFVAYSSKGGEVSEYVYADFTKVLPTLEAPTFTPATGATFEDELDVVINAAEGATILYTVNDDVFEGTAPVTVTLNETSTITAMASMEGYNDSEEVSATYTKLEPYTVGGTATFVAGVDEDPNVEYRKQADITISKDNVTMAYNGTMYDYYTIVDGDTTGVTYTYRIYKNQSIKFTTAAGNIRKIEFNCDSSNPVTGFNAVDGLNMETATWEGNAREVTFTAGNLQVRCYTITVTLDDEVPSIVVADPVIAPENNTRFVNSQEVTITCATEGAAVYYSINDAEYQPYTAAFNINETATVKAYAELEGVQSNVVTAKYYKLTEVSTLAQVNALNDSTDFIFYGNVVVTYQNGSNLWVKDASGYGLIYGYQVPKDIPVGSTLKEEWNAMYTLYRGAINEYSYPNGVAVDEEEPVVEIVPTEYTSAQITTDVINERVILKGITLLDGEGKYMYNAADSLVIFNSFNITKPEDFTKAYDVEGMVSYYGGKVQIMPIAITEAASVDFLRGDVDNNGEVKIGDVTALISYLLSGDDSEINILAADCDQNGEVKIGDVTTLISYLLSGNWDE